MIYKFKNQRERTGGVNAQAVGEELERIRDSQGGRLDTKRVIEEAKREESPLHNAFTWDLEKAAQRCWMMEAATLIRSVIVEIDGVERPAFVSVSVKTKADEIEDENPDRYYQSITIISSKPEEYESALSAARSRLFSAQTSLGDLYAIAKQPQKSAVQRAQKHVQSAVRELKIEPTEDRQRPVAVSRLV